MSSSYIHSSMSIGDFSPITPLRKHPRQLLQILPINLIKPLLLRTIDINNRDGLHIPQVSPSPQAPTPRIKKNSPPHQPKQAQQPHSDSPHHTQYGPGTPSHRQRPLFLSSQLRSRTRRARSGLVGRRAFLGMGRAATPCLRMSFGKRREGIYHRGCRNQPS